MYIITGIKLINKKSVQWNHVGQVLSLSTIKSFTKVKEKQIVTRLNRNVNLQKSPNKNKVN